MSMSGKIMVGQQAFMDDYGDNSQIVELWELWPSILDKPTLVAFIGRGPVFKSGYLAIPEPQDHESFLRQVGHDLAVGEVIRRDNVFTCLFNQGISFDHYCSLVGSITSLLYTSPAPFTYEQIERLYSTLDRLLRGGRDWRSVTHVPTATKAYYRSLGSVNVAANGTGVSGRLCGASSRSFRERFGKDGHQANRILASMMEMLSVAAAVRNGRSQANLDDDIESVHVLLSLFDTDLYNLPLITREGRSGYELPD